ncbi:MAG: hypothetical protein EA352_10995 [Gemmatimonadales bacterium]|nr:MAG: hypothetical protein EA352_10995 [Gemmatimonadales bacterium]
MFRLPLPGRPGSLPVRALGIAALAALLLTACSDPAIPDGTPGDVEARVFVDVGGTGAFEPGVDQPLGGISLELQAPAGEVVASGTTDDEGLVRFADVRPGGYTLVHEGSVPQGAVLASSRRATVSVPSQGGTLTPQIRYVLNPGSLTGVVYRDDTESGDFDADGDFPGQGVGIALYRGTDTSGEPAFETSTDASGSFGFDRLRPGTWTAVIDLPPPLELVGPVEREVQVEAESETRLDILFEGSVLIDIAEARELPVGTVVTVQGVVTLRQGAWGANELHIQDSSGGIDLFLGGTGVSGLEAGDSVQVTGPLGEFNDLLQIDGPTSVEVLGTGTVPEPRFVSGEEMLARTFEGQVATLGIITVEDIEVQRFDNHNVAARTADGSLVEIRVDSRADVGSDDWTVGEQYEVSGVLRVRNGVPRLQVRSPEDRLIPVDPISIADARASDDGETVTVVGVITVDQGNFGNLDLHVQDVSGGVDLFLGGSGVSGLQAGDSVRITGEVGDFNNNRQVSGISQVLPLGEGSLPEPRAVSGADILANTYPGEVVTLGVVTVEEVDVQRFDNQDLTVVTDDGSEITVRVDTRTGVFPDAWEVGQAYEIRGITRVRFGEPAVQLRSPDDRIIP